MLKNNPQKIEDLIENIIEYLDEINSFEGDEKMDALNVLEEFVNKEFDNKKFSKEDFLMLGSNLIDNLYRKIFELSWVSILTDAYFGVVIKRIFKRLKEKGILLFYVLDNSIRDDKFELLKRLYKHAGLTIITPNSTISDTKSNVPTYTSGKPLKYNEIEKMIDQAVGDNEHIIYIEKDDSINYLSDVIKIAEEFQSKYTCIFRNISTEEQGSARVLLGSFGDVLDK